MSLGTSYYFIGRKRMVEKVFMHGKLRISTVLFEIILKKLSMTFTVPPVP